MGETGLKALDPALCISVDAKELLDKRMTYRIVPVTKILRHGFWEAVRIDDPRHDDKTKLDEHITMSREQMEKECRERNKDLPTPNPILKMMQDQQRVISNINKESKGRIDWALRYEGAGDVDKEFHTG